MDAATRAKTKQFFDRVGRKFGQTGKIESVIVTHVVNGRDVFVDAPNRIAPVKLVIPKPSSIHPPTLEMLSSRYRIGHHSRDELANPAVAASVLNDVACGGNLVVLDIGGYFAPSADRLQGNYSGKLVGIVEDTENGFQKYERANIRNVPVVSVARSPLKETEDLLVGESVVHSTEHLLRSVDVLTKGKLAAVIGFGKLGRSISEMLRARGCTVKVHDIDPVRLVIAASNGFPVANTTADALQGADIIISATGNRGLSGNDFLISSLERSSAR